MENRQASFVPEGQTTTRFHGASFCSEMISMTRATAKL